MRIVLVTPALDASGAARSLLALAESWAARGDDVTLITVTQPASDVVSVDTNLERVALQPKGRSPITSDITRWLALRRAIRAADPDVVISNWNRMNVATILAAGKTRVVVRDHREYEALGRGWELMRRRTYRRATAVIVPNPDEAKWMESYATSGRIHVIPPAFDPPPEIPRAQRTKTVVAAGRLLPVKGFDVLVEAFAKTRARHEGWSLRILGDGPERSRLETRSEDLGIAPLVSMPGYTKAIWDEYATAGMFVLSSHLEAFGLVLIEAMAAGVPVVATDCPTGPRHVVSDGVDGLLVPPGDAGELAAAIDRLADDSPLRERFGSRARVMAERFSKDRVHTSWDDLLTAVVTGG